MTEFMCLIILSSCALEIDKTEVLHDSTVAEIVIVDDLLKRLDELDSRLNGLNPVEIEIVE